MKFKEKFKAWMYENVSQSREVQLIWAEIFVNGPKVTYVD